MSGRARLVNRLMTGLFFTASLAYVSFKWTKYYFGRHLDAEAVFFTLALPLAGVDRQIIFSYAQLLAWTVPLMFLAAWAYYRLLKKTAALGSDRAARLLLILAGAAYFLGALYYAEHRKRLISFLLMPRAQTTMFEDHYQALGPAEVRLENKRNVIILVLESIENTYNSEAVFGEKLMPGLERLRLGHLSFEGGAETRGADWTIGALTAYTLGLPLAFAKESSLGNYFGEASDEFLPQASSILKILNGHGYDISFFLGSSKTFGGQDKLFTSHSPAAAIYDLKYFESLKRAGRLDYKRSNWGAPDSAVYAEVKKYLGNRSSAAPFLVVMQMVDTHIGDGRHNGLLPRQWGDLRDCIAEADHMALDFVNWAQDQAFYENTTIIILGDHLLPRDQIGPVHLPDRAEREPYNVFINPAPGWESPARPRRFAAFDLAPTILSAIGAQWEGGGLGLGVSLLAPRRQTLFELKGRPYYETEVRRKSTFYESLSGAESSPAGRPG